MLTIDARQKRLNIEKDIVNRGDGSNSSITDIAANVKKVKNECSSIKGNKSIKLRVISFFKMKKIKLVKSSEISHLIGETIRPQNS
ncbi:hypothetical protein M2263_000835 [Providencia alcalifaciens]|nr:hypothetical protein [Providencia alcalifaciens]